MANRAILDHVALEPDGDIRAHKAVTLTNVDASPFVGTLYDAVSGGSVVVSPETNSAGLFKVWTDPESATRIKVTVDGDAAPTDSDFRYDPRDLFYEAMPRARSLAGSLTLNLAADAYPLTLHNTHTSGKQLRIMDSLGGTRVTYQEAPANNNGCLIIAHRAEGQAPAASQLLVYSEKTTSFVGCDFQLDASGGSGADSGCIRCVAWQGSGTSLIRGVEIQSSRLAGAGPGGTWGLECGVHVAVANADPSAAVGLRVYSSHGYDTPVTVPANTAIYIDGESGWNDFIRCYSSGGPLGFRVASGLLPGDLLGDTIIAGRLYSQLLGPTFRVGLLDHTTAPVGDTWAGMHFDTNINALALMIGAYKNGTGMYPVSLAPFGGRVAVGLTIAALQALGGVPTTTLHVAGSVGSADGAAAGPGLTFTSDTDTGVFLQAANSIAVATGGLERLRIGSDGLWDYRTGGVSTGPGGGAAATLTTIGGAGPTTGLQAGWTKMKTGGTTIWFPHWV
jgi:hypothetical protein